MQEERVWESIMCCGVVCDGNMDMFPSYLTHIFFELLVVFLRLRGMREKWMDGWGFFYTFTTYACTGGGGSRCDTIFSCR